MVRKSYKKLIFSVFHEKMMKIINIPLVLIGVFASSEKVNFHEFSCFFVFASKISLNSIGFYKGNHTSGAECWKIMKFMKFQENHDFQWKSTGGEMETWRIYIRLESLPGWLMIEILRFFTLLAIPCINGGGSGRLEQPPEAGLPPPFQPCND